MTIKDEDARRQVDEYLPILKTYDVELSMVLTPYIIQHVPANFCSDVVNTDSYGFRFSYDAQGLVNSDTWWCRKRRGIIIGDSCMFGKGASSDMTNPATMLNKSGNTSFINLSVMAGNTTQQLIAALPFLRYADVVLICGGLANLMLNIRNDTNYGLYGAFYSEDIFDKLSYVKYKALQDVLFNAQSIPAEEKPEISKIELSPEEMAIRLKRALDQHRRDFEMVVRICDSSVPIYFALPPTALISKNDNCSPEEKIMNDIYYSQGKVWQKVLPYVKILWHEYKDGLKRICDELSINYADLDVIDFKGWCFVDPTSHMTDNGYRQLVDYLALWMKDTISN